MTLDEAINHAEEVAEEKDKEAYSWEYDYDGNVPDTIAECKKCAAEHRQLAEWLKDYKWLLEQEAYEDAISRADAIKKVSEILKNVFVEYEDIAQKAIGSLPLVTSQPKTGYWIVEVWNNKEHHTCSSCQHVVDYEPCYHYCPYCGAKMEEELQWFDIA